MEKIESDLAQLTIRAPLAVRARLSEAASRQRMSVNRFVLQAATREAELVLEMEKTFQLSSADAEQIIRLLDNPPAPNAALQQAFQRREELIGARL